MPNQLSSPEEFFGQLLAYWSPVFLCSSGWTLGDGHAISYVAG